MVESQSTSFLKSNLIISYYSITLSLLKVFAILDFPLELFQLLAVAIFLQDFWKVNLRFTTFDFCIFPVPLRIVASLSNFSSLQWLLKSTVQKTVDIFLKNTTYMSFKAHVGSAGLYLFEVFIPPRMLSMKFSKFLSIGCLSRYYICLKTCKPKFLSHILH